MIRSEELIDKLIADLHFHNYKIVSGAGIFDEEPDYLFSVDDPFLAALGINPRTDLYHGGTVEGNPDYIYQYIDDVFIDYFFRSFAFKSIIIPSGYSIKRATAQGYILCDKGLTLHLNNLFDRCSFVENMYLLLKQLLKKEFLRNSFLSDLIMSERTYGLHAFSTIIVSQMDFDKELHAYHMEEYGGRGRINSTLRGTEILKYFRFINDHDHKFLFEGETIPQIQRQDDLKRDYKVIKDCHVFGEYSLEDLFVLYTILTDKCLLAEDSFLLTLLFGMEDIERSLFMDFHQFELAHRDYHMLDPYILSKDLYLRFTNRKSSKAFTFTSVNDVIEMIQLFGQTPVKAIYNGNTLPLPYLNHHLNLI